VEPSQTGDLTPLTYLAGGVEVAFEKGSPQLIDLKPLINTEKKTVRSVTKELLWNYDKGICYLNAPKAKGITGDLAAAGSVKLGELTVNGRNAYASLLVVSMDGADLAQSKKVLVQVGTTARPYGWKTETTGEGEQRITNLGSSPWNIDIDLQLTNKSLTKAILLDSNGLPKSEVPISATKSGIVLKLPDNAMYLILQ
jgi:hypothetical protein